MAGRHFRYVLSFEHSESLIGESLGLVKTHICQLGVVGAFAVFNENKVPIELSVTGKGADSVKLLLGVFASGNSLGQLLGQKLKLVADGVGAPFNVCLQLSDLRHQIGVTFGAFIGNKLGIVEGLAR